MSSKRFYILVFFLALVVCGFGQQDPQYTQHMYTILPINPGFAGSSGICASVHYRQQWAGFVDRDTNGEVLGKTAPRDAMFTINAPLGKKKKHGIGLTFYNDAYGYQTDNTVKIAYAYRLNVKGGVLSFGPGIDMLSRTVQTDKWRYNPEHSDPTTINMIGESDMYFGCSFGAYYEMQDKWYVGVSATQIYTYGGTKMLQQAVPHLYFLGGYSFALPANPNWTFKPCALLKMDNFKTIPQIDLTFIAEWQEMFWVGASYRGVDAVAILGGTRPFVNSSVAPLRGLEAIISYDITTSKLMRYGRSFGGPEVSIKYCFRIVTKPPTEAYRNTIKLGNIPIEYRR